MKIRLINASKNGSIASYIVSPLVRTDKNYVDSLSVEKHYVMLKDGEIHNNFI
jgi:hypothetical protein